MLHVRYTSRALLVALLVPLWLCCAWVLTQDVFFPVWNASLSLDGTRLITVHTRQFPPPEDAIVRVWDLPSGKLKCQRRFETTSVVFSPDGATVAMGHWNGRVSIRDANTLAVKRTLTLTESPVYPTRYINGGRILEVFSQPSAIQLVHVDSGSTADTLAFPGGFNFQSADSDSNLIVSARRNLFDWETAIFQTSSGRFVPIHSQTFSACPRYVSVSPSSRYVAVSLPDFSSVVLLELADGKKVTEITGIPAVILKFLDEHRLVTVHAATGKVEIWQVPAGVKLREWQAGGNAFSVFTDSTGRQLMLSSRPELTVYDLLTGDLVAAIGMRRRSYFVLFGISTLLSVVWCTLWIWTGRKKPHPLPAVDLAVIHGVLLSLMFVRFQYTDTRADPLRPVVMMLFAELIVLISFTVLWLASGALRWPLRMAGAVGCLGVVGFLIVATWHGNSYIVWQVAIGCVSFLSCLVPAVVCLKWCGLSPNRALPAATTQTSPNKSQLTLRDVMFFATAVGMFFAYGRFLKPSVLPIWLIGFLALNGATYTIVVVLGTWAAMSRRSLIVRSVVFVSLTGLAGLIPAIAFPNSPILPWKWYVIVHALVASSVVLTLGLYRGYSLDHAATTSCARVS